MRRALLVVMLAGCDDALDQRLAIVDEPRVLAVISEPAEAKPGATVAYRAILAGPDGTPATTPSWSFCTSPKPPTEDNTVAVGCATGSEGIDLGTAAEVTGTVPADACILFGPDVPPGGFRPRAADPTGGYYQPVRITSDDLVAIGLSRITCKLPTAPFEVARRYDFEYVPNQNPTLLPSTLARLPANTDVTLTAAWPADSAEPYLYFDPSTQQLVERREAMRVSWFATAGSLAVDATAIAEDDPSTEASTTWHTPGPGTAHVWIVLRDSRGGIAAQAIDVVVE